MANSNDSLWLEHMRNIRLLQNYIKNMFGLHSEVICDDVIKSTLLTLYTYQYVINREYVDHYIAWFRPRFICVKNVKFLYDDDDDDEDDSNVYKYGLKTYNETDKQNIIILYKCIKYAEFRTLNGLVHRLRDQYLNDKKQVHKLIRKYAETINVITKMCWHL